MLHTQFVGELMYEGGKTFVSFLSPPRVGCLRWGRGLQFATHKPGSSRSRLCLFRSPTTLSHVFELKAKGHVEVPGYV
jgi:hypothetical protein